MIQDGSGILVVLCLEVLVVVNIMQKGCQDDVFLLLIVGLVLVGQRIKSLFDVDGNLHSMRQPMRLVDSMLLTDPFDHSHCLNVLLVLEEFNF